MASNGSFSKNTDQIVEPTGSSSTTSPRTSTSRPSQQHLQCVIPDEGTYLKPNAKQAYFSDEKVLIPQNDEVSVFKLTSINNRIQNYYKII